MANNFNHTPSSSIATDDSILEPAFQSSFLKLTICCFSFVKGHALDEACPVRYHAKRRHLEELSTIEKVADFLCAACVYSVEERIYSAVC